MKRKILSLILVAAMLASMLVFAPSAGATDTAPVTVTVGDAAGVAGDTVTIPVFVTATTLQTFSLGFEYDETKLENITWTNAIGAVLPITMSETFAESCGLAGFANNEELSSNFLGFGAAVASPEDASAGLLIGTLKFRIKETATPGDAYIRFVFVEGVKVDESTAVASHNTADKFAFVDGKVAVLADDGVAPTVPASDFTYEDNGDGTCTILKYTGTAGALVIPEYIDGLKVTAISSVMLLADANSSTYKLTGDKVSTNPYITSIVVPRTVEEIYEYAFLGAPNCTSVTVLNPDAVIGDAAIGFEGAWRNNGNFNAGSCWPYCVYDEEENEYTIVTVKGYADSTAASYSDDMVANWECSEFAFVAFDAAAHVALNTVVDGVATTVFVPAGTASLPNGMTAGDKTVIAWTIDGVNYAAGASVTLSEDVEATAITVTTPKTANGASIKKAATAEDLAIRFTADIAQADYAALVEAFGAANVKLGMLVTPQKYVNNAGAFTKEALTAYAGVNAYVDIAVTGYHEKDDVAGTYTLAGSLTGFSAKTIEKNPDFAAVAYISVDVDGDGAVDTTVYGQYDYHTARNVLEVATLANDASIDATEKGLLATIIGWFTNGSKN